MSGITRVEPSHTTRGRRIEIAKALLHALGDGRLDDAQRRLDELQQINGLTEDHPDILTFRVLLAIQRGRALDALNWLNELGEGTCPELRALCLFFIEDPVWQSLARDVAENHPRQDARRSMAALLATLTVPA